MTKISALTPNQLQEAVDTLRHWEVNDGKLHAEFSFDTFVDAFAFMTKVAFAAESAQHHPEWCNVYSHVTIDLVTHDAGDAISQRDIDLARMIDGLV